MTISASEIYLLNNMNSTAFKCQLGTLIQNAETVTASEVACAEGSILIGNSSGVASALSGKGDGKILIGNGTTMTSQSISGDITLSNAGAVAIAATCILDGDVNASAAIARSKLAAGTADHVVINAASTGVFSSEAQLLPVRGGTGANLSTTTAGPVISNGSGVMSTEATLAKSRGGCGADMSSVTFPSSGTILTSLTIPVVVAATITGANGTGEVALGVTIPDNAIILNVYEDADALTGTTDDTGTIELLLGTSGTAISAANAMPAAGVTEVVKSSTGLLTKLTASKELTAKITTRAMASGTVKYFVEYVTGV
jgi:hypothetical protein